MTKSKGCLRNLIRTLKFSSNKEAQQREDLERLASQEHQHFSFGVLLAATKDFNTSNKLGQGGFGPVYKGNLKDGRVIAVKKLSLTSNQGKREFLVEAKLLTRVQHRNVVNLLGYCVHGVEKLLVYEYVVNESLDKLLFKSNKRDVLDWSRRYGIICGLARGLGYLHEDAPVSIIHRDIKASNILLDDKWVPKIADFGMARLFSEKDQTHVSTRRAGTNGYMAPEYAMHGHLSVKADVFSYGVLVLELISGQKNSTFNRDLDAQTLLEWAWKLYKKDKAMEIVDPRLSSSAIMEQITLCIHIGLLCVQAEPKLRPSMGRVVIMLSRKSSNMDKPTRPGYSSSGLKRTRKTEASSSTAKTSDSSSSNTFGTTTTSSGSLTCPRPDPHGKRVIGG